MKYLSDAVDGWSVFETVALRFGMLATAAYDWKSSNVELRTDTSKVVGRIDRKFLVGDLIDVTVGRSNSVVIGRVCAASDVVSERVNVVVASVDDGEASRGSKLRDSM